MSNCKIAGCSNAAIALGLCAMHYMRQRRHGDPTSAKLKPGPKPKPGGKVDALGALTRELERLRAENAALRKGGAEAAGPKPKPDIENAELTKLRRENAALREENAALKRQAQARPAAAPGGTRADARLMKENAALKEQLAEARAINFSTAYSALFNRTNRLEQENSALKKQLADARAANPGVGPAEEAAAGRLAREIDRLKAELAKAELKLAGDPGEVGKLERQLKAARTRVHNLTMENNAAWRARDEAQNTRPNLTSEDLPILIKVFHPDAEHDASPTRKKQLTAGMQIINRIKEGLERAKKKKR